ncbi:mitochondrial import inner membrane translocase subunit TIM23-2-like [Olea europaea subsp. europaea]|uniref:Mitochondrial import inner membrane translocase subunit TIM23-2-like n=1 Tax=Olea europaea subsp. europaea TaxID=158383 RepID=A0A8S0USN3_OLEEU|nr:mitochondrial import inner membrane translocase subunit TIM23-2-like [Olea europaea subsp. europaea]
MGGESHVLHRNRLLGAVPPSTPAKGFVSGVKSIESTNTLKLKINRVFNGSGHRGRQFGNQWGVIELLFAGLESGMVAYRDTDDAINSVARGLGTGYSTRRQPWPRGGAIGGVLVGLVVTSKQ